MKLKALKAAFPFTIPIFAGFWFLGMAYGIYARSVGFSFWYPMIMSMTIFGGSLEFITVSMLLMPFAPLQTFIVSLLVQARHLFYGIAMLDRFKGLGLKKYYLIFGMCDETFSINYTADIPEDVDKGWFMVFVTFLNQFYWVSGATLGGLLGSFIRMDTKGIEFVMTSMFAVIFVEQARKETTPLPALVGFASAFVCLWLFGPQSFMIPTMLAILALLTLLRRPISQREEN